MKLIQLLKAKINDNEPDYTRYVASGSTLEINPTSTGANILVNSGNSTSVTFRNTNLAAYVGQTIRIGDKANNLDKEFEFTDNAGIVSGTMLANGNIAVNIADLTEKDTTDALPIAVMNALYQTIQTYYEKHDSIENLSNYFQVSGSTLVSTSDFLATTANTDTTVNVNQQTLTFTGTNAANFVGSTVGYDGKTYTFSKFKKTTGTQIDITDVIQSQTLKFGTNPTDGNSIIIDGKTYTFKTTPAAATDVQIGADAKTTLANLCAAAGLVAGAGVSIIDDTLTLSNGKIVEINTGTSGATLTELVSAESVMTLFAEAIGKTEYQQGATLTLTKYGANPFNAATGAAAMGGVTTVAEDMISSKSTDGIGAGLSVVGKNNGKQVNQPENTGLLVLTNTFSFNNVDGAQNGSKIAGVRFNADGTPKEINMGNVAIEWANGAKDMTGNYYESSQINLYIGDTNTANGLTQLAGKYTTNYTTQDGAKYGIVTAIFDNGETRAIAQIPIATFVDANSLEALTGNIWIETTASGNATLRTAGEGGAGKISASSLEDSTVDIASEFTDMITTQRAYSAASKIITTADSMLEELLTIKR